MLKSIHKLFLVLFLCCFLPELLQAQAQPNPSVADSVKEKKTFSWKPSALRLGLDASRLVGQVVAPDKRFYEANADLGFGNYFLVADFGTGSHLRKEEEFNYELEGNYFRLGADINFIPDNKDNNVLFIGVRYARSFYNEKLNSAFVSPVFGAFPVDYDRPATARWFEGVAGMKARVWGGLFLGYTIRYKLGLKTRNTGSFASYEVPGFGRVGDGNTFAFNYHVFYRIPFK